MKFSVLSFALILLGIVSVLLYCQNDILIKTLNESNNHNRALFNKALGMERKLDGFGLKFYPDTQGNPIICKLSEYKGQPVCLEPYDFTSSNYNMRVIDLTNSTIVGSIVD